MHLQNCIKIYQYWAQTKFRHQLRAMNEKNCSNIQIYIMSVPMHIQNLIEIYKLIHKILSINKILMSNSHNLTAYLSCLMTKTNKMACTHSEDSDLPGHPPSLISLRCSHQESLCPFLPIECTANTLIRLGGCPGWSESSLGTVILLVLSWGGSFCLLVKKSVKQVMRII